MLRRLGEAYAEVLTAHHGLIRACLAGHDGQEIDTQGDAFFAVFSSPRACVAAAIEMQRAFVSHPWPAGEEVRVRMGVHSGEASQTAAGLVGLDIHRAARIAAAAHGGQIVVSAATAALLGTRCRRAPRSRTWACTGSRTSAGPSRSSSSRPTASRGLPALALARQPEAAEQPAGAGVELHRPRR